MSAHFAKAPLPPIAVQFDPAPQEPAAIMSASQVISGSDSNDTLRAHDTGDTLYGGLGNDLLLGGAGNDVLADGSGNSTMYGGGGDDLLAVNFTIGASVLDGGPGVNEAVITALSSVERLNLSIADPDALSGPAAGLRLVNIQRLTVHGGFGADTLKGGAQDDVLNGGWGRDRLYGGDGNDALFGAFDADRLLGGGGNDLLKGGSAGDMLSGGAGYDTLWGDNGRDTLYGGDGDDTFYSVPINKRQVEDAVDLMTGGAGADHFLFGLRLSAPAVATDRITDFVSGEDHITIFLGQIPLSPQPVLDDSRFVLGTAAADSDDRVIYDAASGNIWFDLDGAGGGEARLFAHVAAGTALAASDFSYLG